MFDRLNKTGLLIIVLCVVMVNFTPPPAVAEIAPPDFLEEEGYTNTEIGKLTQKRARLFETMTFVISIPSAPDPSGRIFADNLPQGATLTDLGDGYAEFSWTPDKGQSGAYEVTFGSSSNSSTARSSTQSVQLIIGAYPLSHGFYRNPYGDGVDFRVSNDHINHNPPIKEDWRSLNYGPLASIPIVAAADGRIRSIVDDNTVCCADGDNGVNCSSCNNSVWIEHANGEWTKYSHFQTGTVTGVAGLDTNDCVVQGQLLGYEGDVGHTSGGGSLNRLQTVCSTPLVDTTKKCGIHLHWEVRMTSTSSDLRVPILCGVPGGIAYDEDTLVGAPCDPFACASGLAFPAQVVGGSSIGVSSADVSISSRVEYQDSRSTAYFAGDHVTLLPGFASRTGTYFHAMIKPCEDGPNGCPPE